MPKKFLCATDGVDHSHSAVELAAELAAKFSAPLTLIAVNIPVSEGRGAQHPLWDDEKFAGILESAKAVARKKAAVNAETVKMSARDPATAIVEYANKNGFDHIVVGTPRKGVARLVLGSVAAAVVAKAHCAVSVAR